MISPLYGMILKRRKKHYTGSHSRDVYNHKFETLSLGKLNTRDL